MEADLSAKNLEVKELESDLDSLRSEFDIKLKDLDNLEDKHEALIKQHKHLVENKSLKEEDSDMFSQYSVPEYDPKVCDHDVCI